MNRVLVAAGVVVVLVAGAGAAAFAYYFGSARSAPKPLALASPAASAAPAASAPGGLDGGWTVQPGSLARYRVSEQFGGQTSPHEAVAETDQLSGGLTIASGSASAISIVAQLTSLHSTDTVAGFNVRQRDGIVQRSLSVNQFPTATFTAGPVTLPSGLADGQQVSFTVPGQLTVHGVTKPETVTVKQAQLSGGQVQLVGQTQFNMTDFGVQPPQVPITVVQPGVTLEFQLTLGRS